MGAENIFKGLQQSILITRNIVIARAHTHKLTQANILTQSHICCMLSGACQVEIYKLAGRPST